MKIAILGAGVFGTALGGILAENGYDIDYYDPKIERESLAGVLFGAKMIVLCVPSRMVSYLLPHLPTKIPLVIATKGLLGTDVFCNFKDVMVISGPGFASDIKAGKKTCFTITDSRLRPMFAADYINFDETTDKKGVLLCGALKNVYAIFAGFKHLRKGSKVWRDFIREAALEMKEILALNGAQSETVDLACGTGDLMLTCDIPSRNYQFGYDLSRDSDWSTSSTVEGLSVLKKISHGEIIVPESAVILNKLLEKIQCH